MSCKGSSKEEFAKHGLYVLQEFEPENVGAQVEDDPNSHSFVGDVTFVLKDSDEPSSCPLYAAKGMHMETEFRVSVMSSCDGNRPLRKSSCTESNQCEEDVDDNESNLCMMAAW